MRFCLGARVALQLATLTASLAASGATSRPVAGALPVDSSVHAYSVVVALFALSPSLFYKVALVLFLPASLLTFPLASCSVANPLCTRLFADRRAVVAWFVSPFGFSACRPHGSNLCSWPCASAERVGQMQAHRDCSYFGRQAAMQ